MQRSGFSKLLQDLPFREDEDGEGPNLVTIIKKTPTLFFILNRSCWTSLSREGPPNVDKNERKETESILPFFLLLLSCRPLLILDFLDLPPNPSLET